MLTGFDFYRKNVMNRSVRHDSFRFVRHPSSGVQKRVPANCVRNRSHENLREKGAMTNARRIIQLCLLCTALLGSTVAYTALAAHLVRGEKIVELPAPGRSAEVCVIPKHFPGAVYSNNDLKAESQLCSIDEYTNAAVCPKTNSTNPGLDFYSLPPGFTPQQVEAAHCKTPGAKKIAKYKLSTSCSYTPSILGYYHLSRILGGIANVPPAVLRTVDRQNHVALGHMALGEIALNSLIHQTWASLLSQLAAGAGASKRDFLLTDDFTQSYGALSVNPTNEQFYKEFFNGGSNNVARAATFRDKNLIVAMLARSADVNTFVGRTFTTANVQTIVQLKDAADLIVIDTLLNQQDRFGNIHYLETYYYRDSTDLNSDGTPKLKSSKTLTPEEVAKAGAVQVKQMLLKDNDCGVDKQNIAKEAGFVNRVAHIDPTTYRNILHLDAIADSTETKTFFLQELVFTANDYVNVRKNLKDLAVTLHQNCTQRRLRLDLDLQRHFSDQPLKPQSCDL
jgi:hypothetical protein